MGLFSGSSPFDQDVEKATDERSMSDNWDKILDICDKVKAVTTGPKDCLKAILKRMNHQNPHVAKQAVSLLDACVNNCNKPFHLEIASRESEQELYKLLKKMHPMVSAQLRQCIRRWANGDFKEDTQLSLIPALYNRLKQEGVDFSGSNEPVKKSVAVSKDAVAKEEEDFARAIALSLKEAEISTKSSTLYPSVSALPIQHAAVKETRKVRALYDFEAAEDNELTFKAGEILHVIDDSDPNWWKGSNQRGEGLFPANFVTSDLNSDVSEVPAARENTKRVQFNEEVSVATLEEVANEVEVDPAKIDRLLHLLHEADPTGDRSDPEEMKSLEDQCAAMSPLIDAELEKLDRRHAHLTKLSSNLIQSLDMYRSLMREMPQAPPAGNPSMVNMPMALAGYPQYSQGPALPPDAIKYPFLQPQAPPQSPSVPAYVNQHVDHAPRYGPPHPNPMPYGHAPPGPAYAPAYPGQPNF